MQPNRSRTICEVQVSAKRYLFHRIFLLPHTVPYPSSDFQGPWSHSPPQVFAWAPQFFSKQNIDSPSPMFWKRILEVLESAHRASANEALTVSKQKKTNGARMKAFGLSAAAAMRLAKTNARRLGGALKGYPHLTILSFALLYEHRRLCSWAQRVWSQKSRLHRLSQVTEARLSVICSFPSS